MVSLKEATIERIKQLPDACTPEDIMYEVNLIAQVMEGLQDAESGKVISTDELLERVQRWSS